MAAMQRGIKPIRTCIVCRKSQEPSQLLRVNCLDGVITPTSSGKSHGRGAWLHLSCGYKAFKSAFKLEQAPDVSKFKAFLDERLKSDN